MIRVIGGDLKNREILRRNLKKDFVRPVTAIVRKSIFDTLSTWILKKNILDLFAGSGILGIESLSRGAEHVVFVEKDRLIAQNLKENLERFNLHKKSEVYNKDFNIALKDLKLKGYSFDLIFVDPPYRMFQLLNPLSKIDEGEILKKDGIIVSLTSIDTDFDLFNFSLVKKSNFGITKILFLRRG